MQPVYEALEPQAQEIHTEIAALQERVGALSEKFSTMHGTLDDARPQDNSERGIENALVLVQMGMTHLQYHLSTMSTMLNLAYPTEAHKRQQEAMAAFFANLGAAATALEAKRPSEEDLDKMRKAGLN